VTDNQRCSCASAFFTLETLLPQQRRLMPHPSRSCLKLVTLTILRCSNIASPIDYLSPWSYLCRGSSEVPLQNCKTSRISSFRGNVYLSILLAYSDYIVACRSHLPSTPPTSWVAWVVVTKVNLSWVVAFVIVLSYDCSCIYYLLASTSPPCMQQRLWLLCER
jgi:hypothetical protein